MTDLIHRRTRLLGPNVPTFYDQPVQIMRGEGCWLWDEHGTRYLDCYNNVPHVGHCHPHVVEAIARQSATLNTHTRYLHPLILDYVERLTATMGHGLDQAIMVCTGSEANDIALRMAQAVSGKTGVIATDNTYHGNTAAVSQLSTRRPPVGPRAEHVRLVPAPDPLHHPDDGTDFAAHVARAIDDLNEHGHGFSGLILCPIFANEGVPSVQPGFLAKAAQIVRQAGGLLIADEVQPGFGRVGSHFWGHDWLGVAPDVVTLGKPMGNGHPVAATVATAPVMSAFREAFGYFNTFGGNPVSMAAAMAVMDVIESEGLQDNARTQGEHALKRLRAIDHPMIREARGCGLFFGVEFETVSAEPAAEFTGRVVEAMKARGVLVNRLGRHRNVLKMRPPLAITRDQIDLALDTLEDVLGALPHDA